MRTASFLRALALSACVSCQAPPAEDFSVLNWNTYVFFSGQSKLDEASTWIAEQAPDLAAFQEVNGLSHEQWAAIAEGWGHEHSLLQKESGYPVSLSSRYPIELIEARVEGFHHGYLHARVEGIDVLVVHFWPTKTHEAEEVAQLAESLVEQGRRVLVLGDFNCPIRHDQPHFAALGYEGETIDGEKRLDYRMTDAFLQRGFVDLVHLHSPQDSYSFSSPALIPRWRKNLEEVYATRRRIDFAFADAKLARRVTAARIESDDASVGQWSDHYPVLLRLRSP